MKTRYIALSVFLSYLLPIVSIGSVWLLSKLIARAIRHTFGTRPLRILMHSSLRLGTLAGANSILSLRNAATQIW